MYGKKTKSTIISASIQPRTSHPRLINRKHIWSLDCLQLSSCPAVVFCPPRPALRSPAPRSALAAHIAPLVGQLVCCRAVENIGAALSWSQDAVLIRCHLLSSVAHEFTWTVSSWSCEQSRCVKNMPRFANRGIFFKREAEQRDTTEAYGLTILPCLTLQFIWLVQTNVFKVHSRE